MGPILAAQHFTFEAKRLEWAGVRSNHPVFPTKLDYQVMDFLGLFSD